MLSLRIEPQAMDAVDRLAAARGLSRSALIRQVLAAALHEAGVPYDQEERLPAAS